MILSKLFYNFTSSKKKKKKKAKKKTSLDRYIKPPLSPVRCRNLLVLLFQLSLKILTPFDAPSRSPSRLEKTGVEEKLSGNRGKDGTREGGGILSTRDEMKRGGMR